jgi:hypothetical protein
MVQPLNEGRAMTKSFVRGRRFLLVATLATCAGAMAISACSDNSNGTEGLGGGGAITIAAAPTEVTVVQGGSSTVDLTIGRSGEFAGPVALKTGKLPDGLTVTLSPKEVDAASTTATATVAAGTDIFPGTYQFTVAGTASNVSTGQSTISVVVTAAPEPPPEGLR